MGATRGRRISLLAHLDHDIGQLASASAILPMQVDYARAALSMLHDLPKDMVSWYDSEVLRFPLMTKAATSGVCYSVGDLCAQGVSGKNFSTLDLSRSARSGAAGFIGYGPVKHY